VFLYHTFTCCYIIVLRPTSIGRRHYEMMAGTCLSVRPSVCRDAST